MSDQTFEEFMFSVDTYGFREGFEPAALLRFYRNALEEADARGGDLPIEALAHLTGTGMTPGAFAAIVGWLDGHGLLLREDMTGLYLHPVGREFLEGFRAYGSVPSRWEELAVQLGVTLEAVND